MPLDAAHIPDGVDTASVSPLDLPRMTVDFETRSEVNVKDVGAWKYAEHPSTRILCLSYQLEGAGWDGPRRWLPGEPFPQELIDHVVNGFMFEAHNATFECAIWFWILNKQLSIPMPKKWCDTLAVCAYRSIPLGLDDAGGVLRLPTRKDKRGKELLQKLSKPRRVLKKDVQEHAELGIAKEDIPPLWNDDPELLAELYEYCDQDVRVESMLSRTLGDLPLAEWRMWVLDQTINFRGMHVDREAVDAAVDVLQTYSAKLEAEVPELTSGAVETVGQVKALREWVNAEVGCELLPNVQADTVDAAIAEIGNWITEGTPKEEVAHVYRVLEIRSWLGSASVKKLYKFQECLCHDDKLRGLLQYHGAGTGRWSGRLVQPQNFPRGDLEDYCKALGTKDSDFVMGLLIDTIKLRGHEAIDMLELLFGDVMGALATSLRGMFTSSPGKVLRVADFSAIEAVVTAWLAGEEWKVEAFRLIQQGEKFRGADDIYCATAQNIFKRPVSKKDDPKGRQVGKTCELAFGYQGGVGAWRNFDKSDTYTDEEVDFFKTEWRTSHPETVRLWYGLERACVAAVQSGTRTSYSCVSFEVVEDAAGKWLTIILPNDRRLWYYNPQIEESTFRGRPSYQVSYEGKDNKKGGKWTRIVTYGGMLTENVVQAISRDLMAEAMIRVEKAGYPIIVTVHDEIVTDCDPDHGSQEEFESLMKIVPTWAAGCPVGVAGWSGPRYKKD